MKSFYEICFSSFTYSITIRFNEFKRNKLHVSSVMIVTQKMFGYCGGLRAVSFFVNRSAMFVEAVFKSTFGIKTASTNIADLWTNKLTALSPPNPNIFCVTIITLLTCIVTYYLAQSLSLLLLFIFSLNISYFPYFKFVTFKTRVILCNTLKKEGRTFRNIGKYIPTLCSQPC